MKHFLKYILSLSILLLNNVAIAQSDTTKTKRIDTEINVTKSTNELKAKSQNFKIQPSSNINFNIEKKVDKEVILKNLNQNKTNNNTSMLMETLPEDSDIIGKKYWKGKDVTHQKLGSTMSLGTIYSTSKEVRVECRDHSYVDGDRIEILLNEKPVSSNISLKGNFYVIYINLEPGYNRIDFKALNQGFSGPNTAELEVYDDKGNIISSKEWNLLTGQTATLGIIKK
jgi:hypothetical protein